MEQFAQVDEEPDPLICWECSWYLDMEGFCRFWGINCQPNNGCVRWTQEDIDEWAFEALMKGIFP